MFKCKINFLQLYLENAIVMPEHAILSVLHLKNLKQLFMMTTFRSTFIDMYLISMANES